MLSCKRGATGQTVALDLLLDLLVAADNSRSESEVKVKSKKYD
jgi:hypothetical protein